MKKLYITPEVTVMEIHNGHLLTGSTQEGAIGNDVTESTDVGSKDNSFNIWGDEED